MMRKGKQITNIGGSRFLDVDGNTTHTLLYFSFTCALPMLMDFHFSLSNLRGMDILSEDGGCNSLKLFCYPPEAGSTLKRKNLLPVGANSFLFK